MARSLVPQVIPALRAAFAAVLPAGFATSTGPPPGGDVPADYLAVAYGGDGRPAVSGRRVIVGHAATPEEFGVWCTLSCAGGDQDGAALLAHADALFQSLLEVLATNRSLGGVIVPPGFADLGTFEWVIEEGGDVVTVFFSVNCIVRF